MPTESKRTMENYMIFRLLTKHPVVNLKGNRGFFALKKDASTVREMKI